MGKQFEDPKHHYKQLRTNISDEHSSYHLYLIHETVIEILVRKTKLIIFKHRLFGSWSIMKKKKKMLEEQTNERECVG